MELIGIFFGLVTAIVLYVVYVTIDIEAAKARKRAARIRPQQRFVPTAPPVERVVVKPFGPYR